MPGAPRRWCPSTVRAYFEALEQKAQGLPVWQGEFYLEGHRGVLTSQGWIKRANRKAEVLLHDAELAQALAALGGRSAETLTEAWRLLCLNQFHDILTGTSIGEVFEDARKDFARIDEIAGAALEAAGRALLPDGAAWLVLDGAQLPGVRYVTLPAGTEPMRERGGAEALPAQEVAVGILVELPEGAPLSARALEPAAEWAGADAGVSAAPSVNGGAVLENEALRVVIGPHGMLTSIHDKGAGREVLKARSDGQQAGTVRGSPCQLGCLGHRHLLRGSRRGRGRADADRDRGDRPIARRGRDRTRLSPEPADAARGICTAPRCGWISTRRSTGTNSIFCSRPPSRWISAPPARISTSSGGRSTARPTATPAGTRAQFEVPAQKWADLSEGNYGVALLNDCKYGYDVRGDVLRLSLIKSATMPEQRCRSGAPPLHLCAPAA